MNIINYLILVIYTHIYKSHLHIRSFIDGHFGYFHILEIANNAAMSIGVRESFHISVFVSFGYITRNGIAGYMVILFLGF